MRALPADPAVVPCAVDLDGQFQLAESLGWLVEAKSSQDLGAFHQIELQLEAGNAR